ncbi:MAG: hypothetical protein IT297_09700, partial [Anaerolineae bacterium]|nr:hypothetical protein [Anaerolineae bacterium]
QIAQSRHDPRVVRRILEATALEEKMRQHDKPIHRLSSTLDDLEMALEKLDFR